MDVMEKVEKTEPVIRDFLVWLWYKSETNHGIIDLEGNGQVEIRFNGRITLETDADEPRESITCSGDHPRLREARFALTENKKITKAAMTLIMGDDEYSFSMDSRWMNFSSFNGPKVLRDDPDDPEGRFYEKAGLMEKAVAAMDKVYVAFIRWRISGQWEDEELPAIKKWIHKKERVQRPEGEE
ncbi:MAG: hypothetical protein JW932_02790 [Deltaproteobacteria bacterium]|nr:hypothetical protein [Deltaproteobacteria bacterium]